MGDILVFLTGQDDIDAAVQLLSEEAQNSGKPSAGTSDVVISALLAVYFECLLLLKSHTIRGYY